MSLLAAINRYKGNPLAFMPQNFAMNSLVKTNALSQKNFSLVKVNGLSTLSARPKLHNFSENFSPASNFLKSIRGPFNGTILHVGSGDGQITAKLAFENPHSHVLGIDLSTSKIEKARNYYSPYLHPNLEFADASSTLLHSRKFDHLFCFCLHKIGDKRSAVECMGKVMSERGRLYLSFPSKNDSPDRLEKAFMATVKKERWQPYLKAASPCPFHFVYPEQFRVTLEKAHFNLCHMQESPLHTLFSHRDEFRKWLKQQLPYLHLIPKNLEDSFIDEVIDNYLFRNPLDNEGRVLYNVSMLEVIATMTAPTERVLDQAR